jgi:predicted murein hydrolase (TIGR00659 family)
MINELLLNSTYAGVAISLVTYMIGVQLKKKFKIGLFNPLLISIAVTIILLLATNVEFDTYKQGAKYLSWFLTPATVCLAIPLYEQLEVLKMHWKAVIAGIVSGVITNMVTVYVLALVFKLNNQEYVTLLPKSITTAIGMGVSEELGGYVTITVAVIVITGVIGNMLAEFLCKVFKIEEPMAKGLAIGTSAHAMGTAKAMEMGEVEGAMSSLSIAVAGILTVGAATIFANFI